MIFSCLKILWVDSYLDRKKHLWFNVCFTILSKLKLKEMGLIE